MATVTLEVTLQVEKCITCGMVYAVPDEWVKSRRRDHKGFYCPNGHAMCYPGESDIEKLERQKMEATNLLQSQINEERHARLVAEKAKRDAEAEKLKLETRIHAGVCSCCNRTFTNLARHMATKHSDKAISGKNQKRIGAAA